MLSKCIRSIKLNVLFFTSIFVIFRLTETFPSHESWEVPKECDHKCKVRTVTFVKIDGVIFKKVHSFEV